ncbi:MAG: hypothetical protein R3E53_07300 [Myxococcota bacterium]
MRSSRQLPWMRIQSGLASSPGLMVEQVLEGLGLLAMRSLFGRHGCWDSAFRGWVRARRASGGGAITGGVAWIE